ncbi:hypothetical protein BpJC7_26770 [Weizmannia acidilactici]|jgi:high-affinity iron transporter|uniref:Iron permease n=1 Tax=Weizmannia acidilactici TaxID=2607726 RepID=A0A5J4JQL4_9BACI|nr:MULTISPECIES: FTR1 family protein [Heyndrickxia]MEC2305409.1 FTR1 family protein [Weizmannia sp. CD-2023]MEC2342344.1 FTR1 family protein [Weizmannia sp. CD-2023]MEC5270167.1 FTR1 family protein [Heyndrickxia coagulans]MED4313631.1 FTR1 family protein [Heyndrickxia coagulans]GER71374.1 hypothetical protein BpJC7_26770 [Weizmannia acidilactici]
MIGSLFISFREGLEAALVIGIILTQLVRIRRKGMIKYVYIGVVLGFITSVAGGMISFTEAKAAEESSEDIFEGVMMLISAGLIAYFILWLHRNHDASSSVVKKVSQSTNAISLLVLSFLSVFREGMELVAFNLTKITENAYTVAIGSTIGIILAIFIAIVVFKTSIKLNLSLVFKTLGVFLILVGGGLFKEGLVKLLDGEELLGGIGMALFIVCSLLIFLRPAYQKRSKKKIA